MLYKSTFICEDLSFKLINSRSQSLETVKASDDKREKGEVPKFKIIREPQEEDMPIEFLVAEIQLPKLVSLKI